VLDLAMQPIANELLPSPEAADERFPLHLRICTTCGLGQVGEYVPPERIFGNDYPYLSSVSTLWVAHAQRYAEQMAHELSLDSTTLVVEIASNDGYLLRQFRDLGIPVLGIEPAENVAELARAKGVETVSTFFGSRSAKEIVDTFGHPRLVVANNVMAHVPELNDFVAGLALLCGDDTVITVENPSFLTLLQETQFDTIYHEHFSYLSAHAVGPLVAAHGLELARVEDLPTHGGSYRYWITRARRSKDDGSVAAAISHELESGLLEERLWNSFARRSAATIAGLQEWLAARLAAGARISGYGAAAKGNTLLNAAGVDAHDINVVADGSAEKQGKYLPGSRIPVVAPSALAASSPTDVLILPWNIGSELVAVVAELTPTARAWTAVPAMSERAVAERFVEG
jgi:hypothetical protein